MSASRARRSPRRAKRRSARPRIAIVGAGRAGTALAKELVRAGYPITAVASRRLVSARRLARACRAKIATTDPRVAAAAADALILAVPDRALPALTRALAAGNRPSAADPGARSRSARAPEGRRPGSPGSKGGGNAVRRTPLVVLHTSGANSAAILAPIRARGWAAGSFHPLLAFPKGAGARASLEGAAIAIDGDARARRLARTLAASLGARPLAIPAAQRARYHLAASIASNYVVTLVWEATRLLEESGLTRKRALQALLPLIRSTVANLERTGLPRALTGPVARGDDTTVARHAALLGRSDPGRRDLHRQLVARTARLAREAGWLTRADVRRIERALGSRRSWSPPDRARI